MGNITVSKMLDSIEKIKRSKKSLQILIKIILNGGEIAKDWLFEEGANEIIKNLKKLQLIRVASKYEDDEEIEYIQLCNRSKRGLEKALEKALIYWSAESQILQIEKSRTMVNLHIFDILRRNQWKMDYKDLQSELRIYYSSGVVNRHIKELYTNRLIYLDDEISYKVIVPSDVIDKAKEILNRNREKLDEKLQQLRERAIAKWKNKITEKDVLFC